MAAGFETWNTQVTGFKIWGQAIMFQIKPNKEAGNGYNSRLTVVLAELGQWLLG